MKILIATGALLLVLGIFLANQSAPRDASLGKLLVALGIMAGTFGLSFPILDPWVQNALIALEKFFGEQDQSAIEDR